MMANQDIKSVLPQTCKVTIPTPGSKIHDVVPRWSDAGVSLPYAVVTPSSEDDIHAVIQYGLSNQLKIIPANGGRAPFIPITSKTVYLDMCNFKAIDLDEEKQEVQIGGGCTSGDVLKELSPKGWHTLTPNSNAVGMIGAVLGGLSDSVNGIHGFGIDHIKAISMIPFSNPASTAPPRSLVLTPDSTGEEKALFNVLCGAGHGLGIITSITLRAWPISSLHLTENKIWTRRLLFPAPAIQAAASLYLSLLPPPPELTAVLLFVRAPPSAPVPGAPMVMLALSYCGPAADAEKVAQKTFEKEYVEKAVMAVTAPIAWEAVNDSSAPLNVPGGFKELHSAFCRELGSAGIARAFETWLAFTGEDVRGRGTSYVAIASWSTTALLRNGLPEDDKFFPARDRGVFIQCVPWYSARAAKGDADRFGKTLVRVLREVDAGKGRKEWCFANNLLEGADMREVYSERQIEEIRRVKGVWDGKGVGWSPVVEGW